MHLARGDEARSSVLLSRTATELRTYVYLIQTIYIINIIPYHKIYRYRLRVLFYRFYVSKRGSRLPGYMATMRKEIGTVLDARTCVALPTATILSLLLP